jgi:angio-associated migratory cell protein
MAGSEDFNVYMWNADKGAILMSFSDHSRKVVCGDLTTDDNYLPFS